MGCYRTGSRWRWPNGIIPYTINSEDFPDDTVEGQTERQAIADAIREWNTRTLLRFQPRTGESNWVEFVASDEEGACRSPVGKKQWFGSQEIHCDLGASTLIHEMGHAVGLIHEAQRDDRDAHIMVHLANMRADKRGNFDRRDDATESGPYDYGSRMHYGQRSFAVDWRPGELLLGQRSTDGPSLAAVGGELHLIHLGNGSNDLWHAWSSDGVDWNENRRIEGQLSKVGPAISEHNGALHMVHLGSTSNDIWHSVSADLRHWAPNTRTDQKSRTIPAIASFNDELHMVHLGDSSNDLWHSWTADQGRTWSERRIEGQKSSATPGLAPYGGALHMVHVGSGSKDLWHSWTTDGRNWVPDTPIEGQQSGAAPALCEFNGRLHLAHLGTTSPTIWHSYFDGNDWAPNDHDDNNESWRAPTLASFQSDLHMALLGRNGHQLWRTVRDTTLVVFDVPGGVVVGSGGVLSEGDLQAVRAMYPGRQPAVSEHWLQPVFPVMVPA